ncbi:MAG: hypothetical protein H6710_23510 [Myxococcales bacterium]|nr:hypothetical protein [Myxococcales bacterium]
MATAESTPRAARCDPFILLSSPRCGSTTLIECLGMHPELEVVFEPFHPDAGSIFSAEGGRPLCGDLQRDLAAFDREVDALFARCDGFKHILHQLAPILMRRLLRRRRPKVLLLRRENLLRQAVSNLLAFETAIWHAGDGPWPPPTLPALDVDRLASMIAYYRDSQRVFARILERDGVDHRVLTYEALFEGRTWPEQQVILGELFAFLGRPPIVDPARLAALQVALDPARQRLASPAIYRRIPNWRAIEAHLGGDANGHLVG